MVSHSSCRLPDWRRRGGGVGQRCVACGHLHRAIQANLGRTPVSVCPSTSYQVCLDMRPDSHPKFIAEPPALQLHTWTGEMLVSHTAYVDFAAEPIDLRPLMGNWDERRERIRNGLPVQKNRSLLSGGAAPAPGAPDTAADARPGRHFRGGSRP